MNDFASIKKDAEKFTNTYATDMILIKLAQMISELAGECERLEQEFQRNKRQQGLR